MKFLTEIFYSVVFNALPFMKKINSHKFIIVYTKLLIYVNKKINQIVIMGS